MRIILMLLCLLPGLASAAATDALKVFLTQTQTVKARFAQMVLDKNGKQLQQAQGVMQFSRPGKFRWDYQKPYEQAIVGDGSKLWIFDKDLNQVTVRKLDRALGSSPAALLSGSNDLERDFKLSNLGMDKGLDWLEALPKSRETVFERVRMGFGKSGLEAMELRDQFGQTTVITFADVERNPRIAAEVFRFTPPQGADVISE
ncbi:MAG: outer membrane lipoprotein chaperone LolA [Burkholderiales bacterium]|jgi:outer membrane lipoprotein carrier protein|nr:outer membrane lipoprotein chaperone LolA [Burkholderiales bacterium]